MRRCPLKGGMIPGTALAQDHMQHRDKYCFLDPGNEIASGVLSQLHSLESLCKALK